MCAAAEVVDFVSVAAVAAVSVAVAHGTEIGRYLLVCVSALLSLSLSLSLSLLSGASPVLVCGGWCVAVGSLAVGSVTAGVCMYT